MASSIPRRRDDRLVGTSKPQPALRASSHEYQRTSLTGAILLGTTSFSGDSVYDVAGRFLGEIEELVIAIDSGRVAYALMSVGGFLGMGRKTVAIPWSSIVVDRVYQRCVLSIDLERLIDAPSLDGDFLPRMADPGWASEVHAYFGCKPYWA